MAADTNSDVELPGIKDIATAIFEVTKEVADWTVGDLVLGLAFLKKHRTASHLEALNSQNYHFDPKDAVKDKELLATLLFWETIADGTYEKDANSMLDRTSIRKENLYHSVWQSKQTAPAFFIAGEHRTKSLVLAIRGTKSLTDALTDLAAAPVEFQGGHAHDGIVRAANYLYNTTKPLLQQYLKESGHKRLVLTGHSLGAGSCCLLTHLLKEDHDFDAYDIHCYAYAPPSVCSIDLCKKHQDCITSVVNEFDIVPRMTVRAMLSLRMEVAEFDWKHAAIEDAHKSKLVKGAISLKDSIAQSKLVKGGKALHRAASHKAAQAAHAVGRTAAVRKAGSVARVISRSLFGSKKKDEEPSEKKEQKDDDAPTPASRTQQALESDEHVELFPPGVVYHLVEDGKGRYHMIIRPNDHFEKIELVKGVVKHHLLSSYEVALRNIEKYID